MGIQSHRSHGLLLVLALLLLASSVPAHAQTRLRLSEIQPGTEQARVVPGGDFQVLGPIAGTGDELFAAPGTNMVPSDGGILAIGSVAQGVSVRGMSFKVILSPKTRYVLSGYLWNMGSAADHVTTVLDFADIPKEPQIVLTYSDPGADQGYFVQRSFSTTDTGTNITLRVFYDGFKGKGTAANYFPIAAQWDNLAITKEADFIAPRPAVREPPPALQLHIANSNGVKTIDWPTTPGVGLYFTPSLANPISWSLDPNTPSFQGLRSLVKVPAVQLHQFFRLGPLVDSTTLDHKLIMGYQGWFACPGDGSSPNRWTHWFRSGTPTAANATVDFWPDISELAPGELFDTQMTLPSGAPAKVYSAHNADTVVRHFKWMLDHNLDGVMLQRFAAELSDPAFFELRNQVTRNVRLGAETHGRVFAIMYDISGQPAATLVSALTNDWNYLAGGMRVTDSPRYLRHHGKPVVAIWGFGFAGRPDTPQQAQQVIDTFKASGLTVMGGLPTYWRTLNNDAQTNSAWAAVFRSFDVISPWSVGRYGSDLEADNFRANLIVPDLVEAKAAGRDYMPAIFPGFSWTNLNHGPFNQIPRRGGAFLWRQAYNAVAAGCSMIYGAMFDEMDEGTALFKLAPTPATLPAQGAFVPLNIDGLNLPSDWYLRVVDEAGKMLRGEAPIRSSLPITP